MSRNPHLYRRGDVFWYRASVPIGQGRRTDVRLSLLTCSLYVARELCAMLELNRVKLLDAESGMLGLLLKRNAAGSIPRPSDEDLKPVIAEFFLRARNAAILRRQEVEGDQHFGRRDLCTEQFDYYHMLLETGTTRSSVNFPRIDGWLNQQVAAGKMDQLRALRVRRNLTENMSSGDPVPVPANERDRLALRTGRAFTAEDSVRLDRLLLEAKREVWFGMEVDRQKTSAIFGRVEVPESFPGAQRPFTVDPFLAQCIDPAPFAPAMVSAAANDLEPLKLPTDHEEAQSSGVDELGVDQVGRHYHNQSPSAVHPSPLGCRATEAPVASDDPSAEDADSARQPMLFSVSMPNSIVASFGILPFGAASVPSLVPRSDHTIVASGLNGAVEDYTIEEIVEKLITDEYQASGNTEAPVQLRTFAKMLYHVMGGAGVKARMLSQSHVGALMDLFDHLPNRWGRTADEVTVGIPASLLRAETLPASEVGLGAATKAKHLSYLSKLIVFAADHVPLPTINLKPALKRITKAKNQEPVGRGRDNWTTPEIERLLDAPPFSGSRGPKRSDRYEPGTYFCHDSAYWGPIALPYTAMRSAEFFGMPPEHVVLDAEIPHFMIRPTTFRRLKNKASVREVPIPPEMLRLGFAEYVRECQRLGHELLFPDLLPKGTTRFSDRYGRSFFYLRRWAFPDGTSSKVRKGGAWCDKDVHSYRGWTITELFNAGVPLPVIQDIVGHCTSLEEFLDPLRPAPSPTGGAHWRAGMKARASEITMNYKSNTPLQLKLDAMNLLPVVTQSLCRFEINLNPHIYSDGDE